MKIAIGSDHAAFSLKKILKEHIREKGLGEVVDMGTDTDSTPSDYPDIAFRVGEAVAAGTADRGVLLCGTGVGMSIAANKIPGAYAAHCHDVETAKLSRRHNNSNILTMGARIIGAPLAEKILDAWLAASFEGGRHAIRTGKIEACENKICPACRPSKHGRTVIFDHPLVQHKVSIIRDKNTPVKTFRELVQEIAGLMVYESTRNLPLVKVKVETPLTETEAYALEGKKLAIVPVLRAGLGMVDGILQIVPNAKVGHIGLYRDPETLNPVEYYCKLPGDISERDIFILDPMLATGGSASAAISLVKEKGGKKISLVSIIAAPEGVARVHEDHPDVDIFTAALDSHLDKNGYIVPGLGDAGDRLFGTK
ncbi:MAG: uracil phosphoribosyltransferase [Aminivibrio sp.]|jgi:uracil phosphoribosyltransferase|nr:uracil phosphoribosyltransferase [Synergistaceae bacterium]